MDANDCLICADPDSVDRVCARCGKREGRHMADSTRTDCEGFLLVGITLTLTPEEALSTAAALTFALEVVGEKVPTPSTIRAVMEKLRAAGVKE